MGLVIAILVLVGLAKAVRHYWLRLEDDTLAAQRAFWHWTAKGLGGPLLLWVVFNAGLVPGLPALLPVKELARLGGTSGLAVFRDLTALAVVAIATYWTGVSFAWLTADIAGRVPAGHRNEFTGLAVSWSVVLLPIGGLLVYVAGAMGVGLALMVWLIPITHWTLPLTAIKALPPLYSRAQARLKFGKFHDAEWEIIRELENCDNDFEGWMLLAELYAVHFRDLVAAEQTICELCDQPNLNASQIAVALHRLADWHLKYGEDPAAARLDLQEIVRRFPDTHVAHMAQQRLGQLPATPDEWRARTQGRRIRLPSAAPALEEQAPAERPPLDEPAAAARANQLERRLTQNPDDVAARFEFARLLAEPLARPDDAVEQIGLLLEMPGQPPEKQAEWLALAGAWHLKYRRDREAAKAVLGRLVREFPQSAQAFAAQRRLLLLEVEEKFRRVTAPGAGSPAPSAAPGKSPTAGNARGFPR